MDAPWMHRGCTVDAPWMHHGTWMHHGCTTEMWMHHGCTWIHVDTRGYTWIHVDTRGYTWIHRAGSRVCSPSHVGVHLPAGHLLSHLPLPSGPLFLEGATLEDELDVGASFEARPWSRSPPAAAGPGGVDGLRDYFAPSHVPDPRGRGYDPNASAASISGIYP